MTHASFWTTQEANYSHRNTTVSPKSHQIPPNPIQSKVCKNPFETYQKVTVYCHKLLKITIQY